MAQSQSLGHTARSCAQKEKQQAKVNMLQLLSQFVSLQSYVAQLSFKGCVTSGYDPPHTFKPHRRLLTCFDFADLVVFP